MSLIRLNKLLSERGLVSRRKADQLISSGKIQINGKKIFELGQKVDPRTDSIVVEGKPLREAAEKLYLMMHKPRGVVTTLSDPEGRPTIKDILDKLKIRVYPVGRLDFDSEGLLLLTNDGDYANRVMTPKYGVTKTYFVKLKRPLRPMEVQKLLRGVSIIGGKVRALHISKAKVEGEKRAREATWWKVIIAEGKNRQIRQMFAKLEIDVLKLRRVAIGRLRLGKLDRGTFVFLNDVAAQRVFMQDPALSPIQSETDDSDSSYVENRIQRGQARPLRRLPPKTIQRPRMRL